jgi:hypothetical protein
MPSIISLELRGMVLVRSIIKFQLSIEFLFLSLPKPKRRNKVAVFYLVGCNAGDSKPLAVHFLTVKAKVLQEKANK